MAKFAPTRDQQRAIDARGSALLVSAAAGSGKTKVLTERLMGYITDAQAPKSIDSFLVITFTRAAAGELRGRIMEELTARMAVEPDNAALRRQYALVSRAQISTIHGFCSALIRENCLPLELDPDFVIVDDSRTAPLKQTALDKVMESVYERVDTDSALRELVDTVGAGRDDSRLEALVLTLHSKMQSHAYPDVWAQQQRSALYAHGVTDPGDTVWGRYLLDSAADTARYWGRNLDELLGLMALPEYEYIGAKYAASIGETADALHHFVAAAKLGWDKAAAVSEIPFPRMSAVRNPAHPGVVELIKARREACKKAVQKLGQAFAESGAQVLADMRKTAPAMDALLQLTMEFDKAFAAEKKRRGFVDYSDLEHFAARLLSDPDGNPTELARQIAQRYTEIMVDEYQDVSAVQELIFRCVSRNGSNLFTVGDVKQSIYRFRLADPAIFTEKYLNYADYESAAEGEPRRILLQENFRSRRQVLEAANAVFENIMSTELGELEYDEHACLRCGAAYEGEVPVPQVYLIAAEQEDEDGITTAREVEADFVAQQIRRLVDEETLVTQNGVRRPVRYEDIVLLMRSANTVVNTYRKALENRGVPVRSEQGGGFYSTPEIAVMTALLNVVDNPMQDVPLITVLQSVYVGFTPDELAQVRASDKKATFYEALCKSAETLPKAAAFLEKLQSWRTVSGQLPVRELIERILADLSVSAVTAAMTDGHLRRRNLSAFLELAADFEEAGARGLRRFTVWLARQAESGIEPEVCCGDGGNAVQIMSIHKSKGLEFPVVFLCDTARRFNKSDSMETVIVHPQMGLGPKVIDTARGIEYYSMPRQALVRKLNRETLSEEMRLLYVAMTRAKEYLFITASVKDPEKTVDKLRPLISSPVPPQVLESAAAPVNWLIAAALADAQVHLQLRYVTHAIGEEQTVTDPVLMSVPFADRATVERLAEQLCYMYPYAGSVELPSKLTATELKYLQDEDPEAASIAPGEGGGRRFRKFRAGAAAERMNAAEKGVATHLVFQHMDYQKAVDADSVREEIARMEAAGILTGRQVKALDVERIAEFFATEGGSLMRQGDAVLREFKFSLLRPASVYFPDAADDEILLQGVIDCAVEKDGAYTIIDYKTDSVTAETVAERAALYSGQVAAYAEAMEAMTGKRVVRRLLYFLRLGIFVEI